uniref:Uncharacterized protein n=1 Tax=Meloidogyne incognita TaxID=6306 RepID=A0A914M2I1_MELIC
MEIITEPDSIAFPKQQLDDLLEVIIRMNTSPIQQPKRHGVNGAHKKKHHSTRLECGQKLFSKIPADHVVDLFIAALKHVQSIKSETDLASQLRSSALLNSASVEQILIQVIVLLFCILMIICFRSCVQIWLLVWHIDKYCGL